MIIPCCAYKFRLFWLIVPMLILYIQAVECQSVAQFTPDKVTFLKEFETFFNATKNKEMEDVYDDFKKVVKSSTSDQEFVQMVGTANAMLNQKMTANPMFKHTHSQQTINFVS